MIFDIVLKSFLSACGAGILTLIILAVKWFIKKIRVDDLTIEALSRDAYFRQARYLLDDDEITEMELENHNYLYEAYHVQARERLVKCCNLLRQSDFILRQNADATYLLFIITGRIR